MIRAVLADTPSSGPAWAFAGIVVTGLVTLVVARMNRPAAERKAARTAEHAANGVLHEYEERIDKAERWAIQADARAARADERAERADRRYDQAERRADSCEADRQRLRGEMGDLRDVVGSQGVRLAVLIDAVQRQIPDLDVEAVLAATEREARRVIDDHDPST
jgi:chromosome segregation ATPase